MNILIDSISKLENLLRTVSSIRVTPLVGGDIFNIYIRSIPPGVSIKPLHHETIIEFCQVVAGKGTLHLANLVGKRLTTKRNLSVNADDCCILKSYSLLKMENIGQVPFVIIFGSNFSKDLTINRVADFKLTERQAQVLFFILRGKTLKQIASILGISNRTVEEHLKQLRIKFLAQNKYELINKAIENGYLNVIPESLFRMQLSLELLK